MPLNLAPLIDHTILKPEASGEDVERICDEALEHGFASVCVNGCHIERVAERLKGSDVLPCCVIGFPLGAMHPRVMAMEATIACKSGAKELDFVAYLPALLEADETAAREHCMELMRSARSVNPKVVIKMIIESAALMKGVDEATAERRIVAACNAARSSGCDFVKTSTGFHPAGGASVEAVKLMKQHAGPLKVKASGGIRTRADAVRMADAGADRLGCSASVAIVSG